jgi:hypothetical protein
MNQDRSTRFEGKRRLDKFCEGSQEGTRSFPADRQDGEPEAGMKPHPDSKRDGEMSSGMSNWMKPYGRVALVAAGLLFAAQFAAAQVASHISTASAIQPVGRPVARVNGTVLTDHDLLREMFNIFPYARLHNGFPAGMEADIRAGAMKMMIFEELVYQQAKRSNMTVPPERVAQGMVEFRKKFDTPEQYQEFVKVEFNGSQQMMQTQVERSMLIDKYLKQHVADQSAVTVAEEKAYYDQHPERFKIEESFVFQSITILPPQNATEAQLKQVRKRAEDTLPKAKATKSYDQFGLLAEKISEDDFRVMMGDHKAADRSKLPPAVVTALAAMQPNQVSDLVEFDKNAYTILRLNGHIMPGEMKFDDVKDPLRAKLQKDKSEELRRNLDSRLRKNAKIEEL